MSDYAIKVYGTEWCIDCRRARQFLTRHKVPFEWINIDRSREAEQYVKSLNHGNRSVPTILFEDGTILVEPSNAQLAEKLCITLGTL